MQLYAALGDDGRARPLVTDDAPALRSRAASCARETAERVLEILATSPHPAGRIPAQVAQGAPRVAFKTGTSYGFRDAWAFGVSNGYAIGVWVGRPDGAPRPGATGRSEALPILFEAFDLIGGPSERYRTPPNETRAAPALVRLDGDDGEGLSILFPPSGAEVLVLDYGAQSRGLSLSARGGRAPLTLVRRRRARRERADERARDLAADRAGLLQCHRRGRRWPARQRARAHPQFGLKGSRSGDHQRGLIEPRIRDRREQHERDGDKNNLSHGLGSLMGVDDLALEMRGARPSDAMTEKKSADLWGKGPRFVQSSRGGQTGG